MYLLILESIGTSELILIGIIALIFLGPRKLPDIARKIGKITSEFRNTTNEFKSTWEREVNFEEEAKAFRLDDDEPKPVERVTSIPVLGNKITDDEPTPAVREIDPAEFESRTAVSEDATAEPAVTEGETAEAEAVDPNDKRNWL